MKNKFIYGVVAADDMHGFRTDELKGMSFDSGTALILHHEGMSNISAGNITLTVDANKMKDVCKAIVNELNHGTQAFVVLGDELTSEYLHPNITAVASTVL